MNPHWSTTRRLRAPLVAVVVAFALIAAAGTALADRGLERGNARPRPDLQRILDSLVTGPGRLAPGATAYVAGPDGTWTGAAGIADVATGRPMQPGLRMHLDSISKAWTATLLLELAADGKLRLNDTVERWLPGLLPDGSRITLRELLNHTSGLIDSADLTADPMRFIARVADPSFRAELLSLWRREQANPGLEAPASVWVRLAAALPLRSSPGSAYHYSNIGYDIAGMVAARAGGAPLASLFHERISAPLKLGSAAYAPQGEVPGAHPLEYSIRPDGKAVEATGWYRLGDAAGSGIVSDARDEGRFLAALMKGRLLPAAELAELETPSRPNANYALGIGISTTGCAGSDFQHTGAEYSSLASVLVSPDGSRVAVVLLNGNVSGASGQLDPSAAATVAAAALRLYCAA